MTDLEATTRKPRPRPTSLTSEYWEAAEQGRLLYARCSSCGHAQFPREFACVRCQSLDVTWVEGSGRGTLYSFAMLHREPFPGYPVPSVLGIIELDEGYSMFGGIVDCPFEQLECDMAVEVTFERQPEGWVLPVFRPTRRAGPS